MMCILLFLLIGFFLLNSKGLFDKSEKNGALAVLNEKYAKGEITDEEYEKKKKLLGL